jgi:SagB-type dehydrogenase family enzyme
MDARKLKTAIRAGRGFLHANWDLTKGVRTDQQKKLPVPDLQKPVLPGSTVTPLPAADTLTLGRMPLVEALAGRKSRRAFSADPLSLEELSFLLWATQGVRRRTPSHTLRTVPSGGARHTFETYLYLARVRDLDPGLYRYLPLDHALVLLRRGKSLAGRLNAALMRQLWDAAAVFIWATVPYRMEWRYAAVSHKVIALDAGHVCQNLYLACQSIGCGTCALGAYDQQKLDAFIGVDGVDEFALYAAPVGRRAP